jgi:hypothetical protein
MEKVKVVLHDPAEHFELDFSKGNLRRNLVNQENLVATSIAGILRRGACFHLAPIEVCGTDNYLVILGREEGTVFVKDLVKEGHVLGVHELEVVIEQGLDTWVIHKTRVSAVLPLSAVFELALHQELNVSI